MRGQKREKLSDIWNKTSGNTLKIFLSFMLILTIGMFIFGNLYTNFKSLTGSITILNQLLSEYVYDFFSLFLYIVVINNINMQYDILYASTEGDENI